jgi:heme exporter protein C
MNGLRKILIGGYWGLAGIAFAGAVCNVFFNTPEEATMGMIQKIFYIHLPLAINTFLACTVVFVGNIGYLWQRRTVWDDLSAAAANVAVVLCSGVLITGMIWGRCAWGQWWTWSPRLTFSFLLWLLYVVYLMVRSSVASPQRRAVVSAVYGIVAFLDVPLVYLSARLLPDIHPGNVQLAPAMQLALGLCFVPVTMLAAGLIALRFGLNRRLRPVSEVQHSEFGTALPMTAVGGAI